MSHHYTKVRLFSGSIIIILWMALLLLTSGVVAEAKTPLDERQTLRVLFAHLEVELPDSQNCVSSGTTTVGEFIETTLAYLAKENKQQASSRVESIAVDLDDEFITYYSDAVGRPNTLQTTLERIKKPARLYQTTLWWNYAEGENVWSRGIQFLMQSSDSSPVEGSFRCLLIP